MTMDLKGVTPKSELRSVALKLRFISLVSESLQLRTIWMTAPFEQPLVLNKWMMLVN